MRLCLAGLIIVSISTVQTYLGPLNHMRLGVVFTAIPMMYAVFRPGSVRWKNLRRSRVVHGVFGLLILACGSAFFGISFGGAARFILENYLIILVGFFLLAIAVRRTVDLAVFIWAFVISVGILVLLSFTVLDLRPTGAGGLARLGGVSTYDANDLGMLFLMGLPLAIMLYFNSGRVGKIVSGAIVLGIPASLAYTGSRGGFVGFVVVAPALFIVLDRVSLTKRLWTVGIIAVMLVLAAPAGYWDQMETIRPGSEDYNYTSDYGRVAIAKRGMGYMFRYPLFGVGIGNFGRAEGTISPLAVNRTGVDAVRWIPPHNTYVQVGSELGLFALLTWIALIWMGCVVPWRLRRRIPSSWVDGDPERRFLYETCLFLPVSFLAFAVTSSFLSHAYTAPFYILLGLLAGHLNLMDRMRQSGMRLRARGPRVLARHG